MLHRLPAMSPGTIRRGVNHLMRFIHLYLVGYVILVLGVILALWKTGVLERMTPIWIVIMALVAIGMGIMLSVSSGKPSIGGDA